MLRATGFVGDMKLCAGLGTNCTCLEGWMGDVVLVCTRGGLAAAWAEAMNEQRW